MPVSRDHKMAEYSSGIGMTGSDRPSLKDLHDHVVMQVADKWRDLGVQLLQSDQQKMLDFIETNYPRDVIACCKRLFKEWLDNTGDATWNQLIKALKSPSIQQSYLANRLEQMLIAQFNVASEGVRLAGEKLTTIKDIEIQFAKMTNRIKQALINNNVDVASLIEQLCAISAVRNKKVPLFDEDVFDRIKSVDEFWRRLRFFWNIFDYELLQYIIEISDCAEAQEIIQDFLSRIDPSAIEDADLVLHCREEKHEGLLKPVLRIKVNAKKCTLSIKRRVEEIVSKSYDLNKFALHFHGIRDGCIELLYYISKSLKIYLLQFKISEDILKKFLAIKIISLYINGSELKIPSTTIDSTAVGLHSESDIDRSSVLDSVEQPPHTRRPPPSSHVPAQTYHENLQSHATYYTDHGPKGQPSATTIPPVGLHSESDIGSSVQQYTESLTSAQLPSVSTPLKFNKLNERDVENVDSTHEVVVCGPGGVGKTTIINCYVGNPNPNIRELDQQFKTQGVSIILGDKESHKTMRLNFREADKQGNINDYGQCAVAVVVYDASSNGSLRKANQWITKIKQHLNTRPIEFILVGNKTDVIKNNEIMLKGVQFANEMKMRCIWTCATSGLYMDKLLENVAELCKQHMENDKFETRFTNLEKKFEEKQKVLEENQKLLQEHLEKSQKIIQSLQESQNRKRCTIL